MFIVETFAKPARTKTVLSVYKGCVSCEGLFPLFPVAFIFILSADGCFISQKRGDQIDTGVRGDSRADAFADEAAVACDGDVDCVEGDNQGFAAEKEQDASAESNAQQEGLAARIIDSCSSAYAQLFDEREQPVVYGDPSKCSWMIKPLINREYPDPDLVNITYLDIKGTRQIIPRINDETECGSLNAWFYQSESDPMVIGLCPTACQRFWAKDYMDLVVEFGCHPIFVE